ncbi:MAG: hypothetical protein ACHQT8_04000 [Chlamydiales bacterium]
MRKLLFAVFVIVFMRASCADPVPLDLDKLATGEKIVLTTKRILLEEYPGAFNPSLIKIGNDFLLTFRFCPDSFSRFWINYIGVVFLDENFNQISKPQILTTRPKKSKTPSQTEDARLFFYRDKLFLIYNDNVDVTGSSLCDRRDIFMAELQFANDRFTLSPPLKLIYAEKCNTQLWQKNWLPFEWNKTLMLSYSLNPHEVIAPNFTNGVCYHAYETRGEVNWKFGTVRGSTPPLLMDGEYFAFFHSAMKTTSSITDEYEKWHYFMGAYTFSAEPPFQITKISSLPIVAPEFYPPSNSEKKVIFPGGCVISDNTIYVAYGKDDNEVWIATLDKAALLRSLVPIFPE